MIRAYNRSDGFIDYSHILINKITLANQITSSVYCWYTLRLDLMTIFVMSAGCAGVILLRSEVSAVLLSLMLTYLMQLQSALKFSMNSFAEIQRKMVSLQRLWDLDQLPQEAQNQPSAIEYIEQK